MKTNIPNLQTRENIKEVPSVLAGTRRRKSIEGTAATLLKRIATSVERGEREESMIKRSTSISIEEAGTEADTPGKKTGKRTGRREIITDTGLG